MPLRSWMISQTLKSFNHISSSLITFYCWYVTSRCDLDLWLIDLEHLYSLSCD